MLSPDAPEFLRTGTGGAIFAWRKQVEADRDKFSAVTVQFLEKALAIMSGFLLSETQFLFWSMLLKHADMTGDDRKWLDIAIRVWQAIAMSIACPVAQWLLRGKRAEGETLCKDGLKLLRNSCPLLLAWAWKDVVAQWRTVLDEFWGSVVIAAAWTCAVALVRLIPCIRRARMTFKARGHGDSLRSRFLAVPYEVDLSVGYAWDHVAAWGITEAQLRVKHEMTRTFIQIVYFMLIMVLSKKIILALDKIKKKQQQTSQQVDKPHQEETCCESVLHVTEGVALAALSFLFAFALFDTMNDWYFVLIMKCAKAVACPFESNLIFSMLITFAFGIWTAKLGADADDGDLGEALVLQGMAVSVGFSWCNTAAVLFTHLADEEGIDHFYAYLVHAIVLLPVFAVVYHSLLAKSRKVLARFKKQDQLIIEMLKAEGKEDQLCQKGAAVTL